MARHWLYSFTASKTHTNIKRTLNTVLILSLSNHSTPFLRKLSCFFLPSSSKCPIGRYIDKFETEKEYILLHLQSCKLLDIIAQFSFIKFIFNVLPGIRIKTNSLRWHVLHQISSVSTFNVLLSKRSLCEHLLKLKYSDTSKHFIITVVLYSNNYKTTKLYK